ncbi:Mss4-like protein [Suillus placidus]|uniref:Mss4-like protein n=1 Tax=Suillus placidus TaxID=48579 RepID=A0A9P6ZYG3_9AGAM|nr:Mss4-like protein [Suillus placidus]
MLLANNVHLESQAKTGPRSCFYHPPPEDQTHQANHSVDKKSIPDTGWRGSPLIPPSNGGDYGEELFKTKYESSCWCGAVRFAFAGDPFDAKHCHCRQSQRLHGAPFQWAVIFPKTSVRILENNSDALHCFSTTTKEASHHVPCKVSCDICRAPLFDEGKRTVLACPIPLEFQPSCHIFYGQRVMEVCDGIPKRRGHKNNSVMPRHKGCDEELQA